MSDPETLRVYAEKVEDYVAMTASLRDPQLERFITALRERGHVLDLGCGPGREAGLMADAGFRVTAVDAVPEMVERAARHPGVTARCARFGEIDDVDTYDGVWANFSLLHASREDLPGHLAALHRALKPGGLLHLAVKTGTGAHRDRLGRLYTYYTDDELTGLLEAAGFACTGRVTGSSPGLSGEDAPWIAIAARA